VLRALDRRGLRQQVANRVLRKRQRDFDAGHPARWAAMASAIAAPSHMGSESGYMPELERRIESYRASPRASTRAKLNALVNIARLRGPGVLPFLLDLLRDQREAEEVRIQVLRLLRNGDGHVVSTDRSRVAMAIGEVLTDTSVSELRVQAAIALGEFVDIAGVISTLSGVCRVLDESIDIRYAAFTSLERAGPTPECIVLLHLLKDDDTLGRSALNVLSAWHIE
jgi:hypothetical protein